MTPFAWSRSSRSAWSRDATVREIFDRPLMDACTSAGESSKVVEMVSSAFASCSVSTFSVVVVRSLKAATTSYAGVVRFSGISLPGSQLPRTLRLQGQVLRAQDRLDRMAAPGPGAELRLALDPEGHLDVVSVQVDLVDLADLDPGDTDLVAGLEPARLRERRAVRLAVADQREGCRR